MVGKVANAPKGSAPAAAGPAQILDQLIAQTGNAPDEKLLNAISILVDQANQRGLDLSATFSGGAAEAAPDAGEGEVVAASDEDVGPAGEPEAGEAPPPEDEPVVSEEPEAPPAPPPAPVKKAPAPKLVLKVGGMVEGPPSLTKAKDSVRGVAVIKKLYASNGRQAATIDYSKDKDFVAAMPKGFAVVQNVWAKDLGPVQEEPEASEE